MNKDVEELKGKISSLESSRDEILNEIMGVRAEYVGKRDKLRSLELQLDIIENEIDLLKQGQLCMGDL